MLSDRFFKIFGAQITLANLINAGTFSWSWTTNTLHVSKNGPRNVIVFISLLLLYAFFLIGQLVRLTIQGKSNDTSFYFLYALTIGSAIVICYTSPVLNGPKTAALLFNELARFLKKIQVLYGVKVPVNSIPFNKLYDSFLLGLCTTFPMCGFLLLGHFIMYPNWPIYFTSLLPKNYNGNFPCIFMGTVWFISMEILCMNVLSNMIYIFTYTAYFNQILIEYICDYSQHVRKPNVFQKQMTISAFRTFDNIQTAYRQLEIIHVIAMDFVAFIFVPFMLLVGQFIVYCNYTMIRYWKSLDSAIFLNLGTWSFMATFSMLVGLEVFAMMHNRGRKILRSMKHKDWGSKGRNREMSKFVRSCKPLCFGYGRTYILKKISVLKFIKSVVRGTLRALLAIKM